MKCDSHFKLANGQTLKMKVLVYPVQPEDQWRLISLWRTEWRTANNYDWLCALNGDYCRSLTIQSVIGKLDGVTAGTATVCYPKADPEVAVVGSVLTHPNFRRLGIAEHLTNAVTDLAFTAGCKVSYLGTEHRPRPVYLRSGYNWHNGGVMRRAAPGSEECENEFFAPGQKTRVRPAAWGDLSGLACLLSQSLDCWVIDYPRGYISGKHIPLHRCVSNFPYVYDSVTDRGGAMMMLIGEKAHRVLGFGTVTPEPGPASKHVAIVDAATHDDYIDQLPRLVEKLKGEAVRLGVRIVRALVGELDLYKKECFLHQGFRGVAELSGQLNIGKDSLNVTVLESSVATEGNGD